MSAPDFITAIVEDVRKTNESKPTQDPMAEYEKSAKSAAFQKLKRALESDNEQEFYEVMAEIKAFEVEDGDASGY